MKFKESVENNPFIALSVTALTAASVGWGAHIAILSQTRQDTVLQGTYVLKEEIENGGSKLYVTRREFDKLQIENAALSRQVSATESRKGVDSSRPSLLECQARLAALQKTDAPAAKQECPQTILDNFYIDNRTGTFNVSACLADAADAAAKLGASGSRKDNSFRMQGDLGTKDGYFCNVACYDSLISVSCNSLAYKASVGTTARIRDYMSYK